jgi:hypothetical protein
MLTFPISTSALDPWHTSLPSSEFKLGDLVGQAEPGVVVERV